MNDILPPKRPLGRPDTDIIRPSKPQPAPQAPSPEPVLPSVDAPLQSATSSKRPKKILLWIILAIIGMLIVAALAVVLWYTQALQPVNTADKTKIQVKIVSGSSPDTIGELLEGKKLIKSKVAFDLYTRLSQTRSKLQAGTYSLSPSESTEAIVAHMVGGRVDKLTITFLPGATVAENKKVLVEAGFSAEAVDAAFAKTYTHALFTDKPAGTDLEGYIYGETYNFNSDAAPEEILTTTFDHYFAFIKQNALVDGFKQQNLNLFQAITLASIVQREVSKPDDQKQVAQVFLHRLSMGMPLGSDVTYQYAAKKLGVSPSPDLDSPYNTRKVTGLPPGPIASPGKSALTAVAHPASGDYLYFLSGDDNITYFAHTAEEHEANIQKHCHVKCSTL